MYSQEELDFAYKYPFSEEAKKIVAELGLKKVEMGHVAAGKNRVENAFQEGKFDYQKMSYEKMKLDFLISYVYARMLVSSFRNLAYTVKYATAEAKRASQAMQLDTENNLVRIANELNIDVKRHGDEFSMDFPQFLMHAAQDDALGLVNQKLQNGVVVLDKQQFITLLVNTVKTKIESGMPIKREEIPKVVLDSAKDIKLPIAKIEYKSAGGKTTWIDKLLETPIPDCRHRTVNLILAPYLVNSRGYTVDKAVQIISNYITLCKTVNPDTNITERYIKYQCEYAKKKGMRTLSLKRARVELSGIDFKLLLGEDEAGDDIV